MTTEASMVVAGTLFSEEEQMRLLAEKERDCLQRISEEETIELASHHFLENIRCPPIWDGIMCWNRATTGQLLTQACPAYVVGFRTHANASKFCAEDGMWYTRDSNHSWTNFTQCYSGPDATLIINTVSSLNNVSYSYIEPYLQTLKTIAEVGYGISMLSLLIALVIFASIKKLRCPRNILHMHLFTSFVMRAFMTLLKDSVFKHGLGLTTDLLEREDGSYFNSKHEDVHWLCRTIVSLWQYFIMANYSWILMEGLYLHSLIFLALFTDSSAITLYVILGWGLPAIFVLPWAVLRAILENTWCWTTHDNTAVFLLIRVPTTASIVVNFILFINIIRVLLLKLKSSICEETKTYSRWAKSTLVLVPLFGVHYMVFLGLQLSADKTAEIAWLFCDQLFASFSGFFIALLYCFMNGEVRTEISKKWRDFSLRNSPEKSSHSEPKLCNIFRTNCFVPKTHTDYRNKHFTNGSTLSICIVPNGKGSKFNMITKHPSERSLQDFKTY